MNCRTLLLILLLMCCCGADMDDQDSGCDCACKAALLLSLGALSAGCLCPGQLLNSELTPPTTSAIIT